MRTAPAILRWLPSGAKRVSPSTKYCLATPKPWSGAPTTSRPPSPSTPANPAATEVGPIQIDARDLQTDDSFRNRALRRQILQSTQDEFRFVTFEPTSIDGLPASVAVGESFDFQMSGELTIRDVTSPVTFDVSVTPTSENENQRLGDRHPCSARPLICKFPACRAWPTSPKRCSSFWISWPWRPSRASACFAHR